MQPFFCLEVHASRYLVLEKAITTTAAAEDKNDNENATTAIFATTKTAS